MPKILVIDDDLGMLKLVEYTLNTAGFTAVSVKDGFEAITMAEIHHPQAILLDDSLPAVSAQQVAAGLRENAHTRHIPIIIFSSSTYNNPAYAQHLGGDAMIAKPFVPKDLINCLRDWVQT